MVYPSRVDEYFKPKPTGDFRPLVSLRIPALNAIRDKTKPPNKAPEPTTMAVTPRAISRTIEMKPQKPNRHVARGAPAMVVAHL